MAKFVRKGKDKGTPAINTASLPDIVFMLLFFFMVATTMKETETKVKVTLPSATETVKLEKKSLVSNIYVGSPLKAHQALYGIEPKIQLDDSFEDITNIQAWIIGERETRDEKEVPKMTTSLKADEKVTMGIITDIKTELRKVGALKLNYSARKSVRRR
ncbi:ExbD/TolR family protein [Bacteroidota bacterium]